MTEIKIVREDEKATAILAAIRQIDDGEELAPVRHGRWERHRDYDHQVCSECKRSYETNWFYTLAGYRPFNYCPNCGAKMDLEV